MSYLQTQMHIKSSQHIHKDKVVVLLAKDDTYPTL
jgi:hypothetical protein